MSFKQICALVFFIYSFSSLTAEKPQQVNITALGGSSGLGMVWLFENKPLLGGVRSHFETAASPDVLLPKLLKGETDIGILPPNVAAKVYNTNKGSLVMGAVVGAGMLSLVTRDKSVKTIEDLKGKTIYVAMQGATPEYILRYFISNKGLKEDSVTLDFSIPPQELAAALVSGKITYAVLPEPFTTVAVQKDPTLGKMLDFQKLWAEVPGNSSNYPMTVVVIRKAFAQNYPETVRAFLDAYRKSIDWTNSNPVAAGVLAEKHGFGLKAEIAATAIPNCSFMFVNSDAARFPLEQLFGIFLQFAPQSIGGKEPDAGFYFK